MAYTDDWESLMNGVFGAGGRVKFGSGAAQPDTKAKTGGLPDLNAALLEQQKQLDELLKKQNAQLKKQDADTQTALENSRQMLRDMENDGLLAKGTADTKPEHLGSFEGLATEVKKTVLGQDAFVDGVVRAMRRPFVLGTEAPVARNVILLSGAPGTGRHFALEETARIMAARGLLQSDKTAVLDLDKLRWLKAEREKRGLHYLLEVDGGVDDTTAPLCVEAGADVLVAGSAVFGKDDRTAAVRRLAAL